MINDGDVPRELSGLVVPPHGSLEATGDLFVQYRLVDDDGAVVVPAAAFFAELAACGRPATTQRSYGMDLLRWFRFLWALGVGWDQATQVEACDFCRWLQVTVKPTRSHWRYPSGGAPGTRVEPAAAGVNPVTGKASRGERYEASTAAHCESVLRGFYDFHLEAGTGPMLNPFPLSRHRRAGRAYAHHNPMEPFAGQRSGRYRPKVVTRAPRSIPDERFDALFAQLGSHRDRALVAFWVSTGARASELLGATVADADPGQQLITVMRKGTRVLQPLPAAPDAFVWLRLYQAQLADLVPAGRDEPLWWTLRRPFRSLGYDAARAMFTRANAALGSNWSLHDLRHTAAYRMARDPEMPLSDVQWVLGHAHLSTTQRYLNPVTEDVIAGSARLPRPATRPRSGSATAGGGIPGREPADPVRRGRVVTASGEQVITAPTTDVVSPTSGLVKPTGEQLLAAFAPRPIVSSWPATEASRSAVLARALAPPFTLDNPGSQQTRRLGVLAVLSWLQTHPGDSWQQRWQASGAEEQSDWRDLITSVAAGRSRARTAPGTQLPHLRPGLLVLVCADVIRPSLGWLLRFAPARRGLAIEMGRTRDSAAFAALSEACTQARVGLQSGQQALTRVAVILAAKGGPVAEVQVGDCVELLQVAAGLRASSGSEAHAHSPLFYQLLRSHHVLGQDAPAAIEMFSGRGQPTCEQLIDRYRITCRPVRDVLVDYLRERQPSVDFSSLQRFAYLLGKLFWADLQAHHPGIDSLQLPREVAAAWKQRVMTRTRTTSSNGEQIRLTSTRLDGRSVLSAVRAFYLDIAEWADDDPARWGPWAVRCPVSASDVSHKKDRSRRKSRMDQRTRERLPVLPALVSWVQTERTRTAELLAAAERCEPGQVFTTAGETLRRTVMKTETTGRIWAEHLDGGRRRNLSFDEHRGFWTWSMVEVLRHTGVFSRGQPATWCSGLGVSPLPIS